MKTPDQKKSPILRDALATTLGSGCVVRIHEKSKRMTSESKETVCVKESTDSGKPHRCSENRTKVHKPKVVVSCGARNARVPIFRDLSGK